MNYFDSYVTFIFIIKFAFLILALTHIYYNITHGDKAIDEQILYWKNRVDFVFNITMAVLLFFIFNPFYDNTYLIDRETKLLFYLFGIILIITAKWNSFIQESKLYHLVQSEF